MAEWCSVLTYIHHLGVAALALMALDCVALSVLQCAAVCYSLLQCVAVCCSACADGIRLRGSEGRVNMSKETYIYVKRDLCMSKETCVCKKRPVYVKRDLCTSKETYGVLAVCCSVLQCVAV